MTTNTTTMTRTYTTVDEIAAVDEKLRNLKARADKRGFNVELDWTIEQQYDENDRRNEYTLTLTYGGSFNFDGGWRLIGVADATATDEPLIFMFGDEHSVDAQIDMSRCDHCHRSIRRNKVLLLIDENSNRMQVGGSCSVDFLGHDPEWATWIGEAIESNGYLATTWPVGLVLDAAIEAYRLGYRKATESMSNKEIVRLMLNNKFWTAKEYAEDREMLAAAAPSTITVDELLDWMCEQDGTSEFGSNLARIARSEAVTGKVFGLVAYAPAGFDGWRQRVAEQAAKRAADEARKAESQPVPVTAKRIRIEGVITTMRDVRNDFGITTKIRVVTDAGWACWGTLPSSVEDRWVDDDDFGMKLVEGAQIGDRIGFDAKINPSEDDQTFGFFSRPTKGEIIARAAAV